MSEISRLVMVDLPGTTLTPDVVTHLERYRPGGVILFRKNIESTAQTRALTDHLREILGEDVLLAIDQEGGGVWRTTDLPCAPSAMSLGSSDDLGLARAVGAMVGRGMRAMGLNWDFAPVLDLNNNPQNPVISDRSFGEDPRRVAALAGAWAEGLMAEGVAACGKHFPGHGDTALDSHLHLPTLTRNLEGLEEYELLPFRRLAHDLPSLMTAHIIYPSIDPEWPATLSRKILTGLLRERGGFQGVIVSDSMGMKAIDDHYGRGEAAIKSVLAGADMIEALGAREAQIQTFEALEQAANAGVIPQDTIKSALRRLRALAERFPSTPKDCAPELESTDQQLAVQAWAKGIALVGETRLPPPGSKVLLIAADEVPEENVSEVGVRGIELASVLAEIYDVQPMLYPTRDPLAIQASVREARGNANNVIFASSSRHRLRPEARALAEIAVPDLHLALWNPYAINDVLREDQPVPAVLTFGCRSEALQALLPILRLERPASGRVPVKLR